jgi:NitT/TauT family transport system substrate-binding protein
LGSVSAQDLTPVSVVLQWVPQAQFAGYFAADALGYWEEQGLDVTIIDGGPDVAPQVEGSLPTGPEFAVSWVPRVLAVRREGSDLVNIAQTFQRSGTPPCRGRMRRWRLRRTSRARRSASGTSATSSRSRAA